MALDVIEVTKLLVSKASVTPHDAGCQEYLKQQLATLGFSNETMVFADTTNLWARRGHESPVFCFAGHTDVVPTGPIDKWKFDPFIPTIENGFLYGRGSADMKASIAAMLVATERFVKNYPDHKGSIAFLITSDEEGPFINGTTKVIDTLEARSEKIDYCIVGEPSSTKLTGDVIKNGRRGSFTADLTIKGIQGHVAYPHLVDNPIHAIGPVISELVNTQWDQGNAFFPATSMQISNITGGTGATNVVPDTVNMIFNFRYSTELTYNDLQTHVYSILDSHKLSYHIKWTFNGLPFLTKPGTLVDACTKSIRETCGIETELSTAGGTSDGRFIAPTGAQIVELGPENATIHKINECVNVDNVKQLEAVYYQVLMNLLVSKRTVRVDELMGLSQTHLLPVNKTQLLHNSVVTPFLNMQKAAASEGVDIQICSGFRSFDKQLSIWNRKWAGELPLYSLQNEELISNALSDNEKIHAIMLWSALPGASRHHWGSDFDVYDRTSVQAKNHTLALIPSEYEDGGPCEKLSEWINQNAAQFGFYLPYAKYVGGVAREPWHLSYKEVAHNIQKSFVVDELYAQLEQADILGKSLILKQLPSLVNQYTFNLGPK
jgi:succinyl-diaminopimelate desuccinylase